MNAMRILPIGLALLALAFVAPDPRPAEADEGRTAAWIYDIHVVRVDTTAPAVVEKAPDWLKPGATTVELPWSALLTNLKGRGTTTVLMDQRVTGLAGREVLVRDTRDRQIEQFSRRDRNNETYQNSTITTGCTAKLMTSEDLQYNVEVKWALARQEGDLRPALGTTAWSGDHPVLDGGKTLALRWAKQSVWEGRETRGIEIYAFVTAVQVR